jgi:hypothetical protein
MIAAPLARAQQSPPVATSAVVTAPSNQDDRILSSVTAVRALRSTTTSPWFRLALADDWAELGHVNPYVSSHRLGFSPVVTSAPESALSSVEVELQTQMVAIEPNAPISATSSCTNPATDIPLGGGCELVWVAEPPRSPPTLSDVKPYVTLNPLAERPRDAGVACVYAGNVPQQVTHLRITTVCMHVVASRGTF